MADDITTDEFVEAGGMLEAFLESEAEILILGKYDGEPLPFCGIKDGFMFIDRERAQQFHDLMLSITNGEEDAESGSPSLSRW